MKKIFIVEPRNYIFMLRVGKQTFKKGLFALQGRLL